MKTELPKVRMTPAAFFNLPIRSNYRDAFDSASGRPWRQLHYDEDRVRGRGIPFWLIGQVTEIAPGRTRAVFFEPIISLRADTEVPACSALNCHRGSDNPICCNYIFCPRQAGRAA